MHDVGSRLRVLIARRGLSVDQAAALIGIAPSTLERRMASALLSQQDVQRLVRLLRIDDWQRLFFPELAAPQDPYASYDYPDGYPKERSKQ